MESNDGNVFRLTGNPENFITAAVNGFWGLNEKNGAKLEDLNEGDKVIFHATGNSSYRVRAEPKIIGYATVSKMRKIKNEPVWIQEFDEDVQEKSGVKPSPPSSWPYIFGLKDFYFFVENNIDTKNQLQNRKTSEVMEDLKHLIDSGVSLSTLNIEAEKKFHEIGVEFTKFPHMGSISRVNNSGIFLSVIDELIDDSKKKRVALGKRDLKSQDITNDTEHNQSVLASIYDSMSKDELRKILNEYKGGNTHYKTKKGEVRTRLFSQAQIARVKSIEDYCCQICGYKQSYKNKKGSTSWVCDVDHIMEKSKGNGEECSNLIVLCPNCHREKTAGLINIDVENKKITKLGETIDLHHDFHLGWS